MDVNALIFIILWVASGLAFGGAALIYASRHGLRLGPHRKADIMQCGMFLGPVNILALITVRSIVRDEQK